MENGGGLLRNGDEAVTKARAVASAEPSELHVGYSPTPPAEIVPKMLRAFQRAMPNVHVRLHDSSNHAILNGIPNRQLQLRFIVPPLKPTSSHHLRHDHIFPQPPL